MCDRLIGNLGRYPVVWLLDAHLERGGDIWKRNAGKTTIKSAATTYFKTL